MAEDEANTGRSAQCSSQHGPKVCMAMARAAAGPMDGQRRSRRQALMLRTGPRRRSLGSPPSSQPPAWRLGVVRPAKPLSSPSDPPERVTRLHTHAPRLFVPPSESGSEAWRGRESPVPEPSSAEREVLPIPDRPYDGPVYEDAKDPDGEVPADRAAAAAGRRAERPDRPARRRRLRLLERVRRAVPDADGRAPGRRGAEVQPLPHDRALLADARGAALGPQPPLGRDGRDHRDRDLGARATTRSARTRARRWRRR